MYLISSLPLDGGGQSKRADPVTERKRNTSGRPGQYLALPEPPSHAHEENFKTEAMHSEPGYDQSRD